MKKQVIAFLFALTVFPASGQYVQELYQTAMEARATREDSLFLYSMQQLNRKRPLSAGVALPLAEAFYRNNRPDEGLDILHQRLGFNSDTLYLSDSLWLHWLGEKERKQLRASRLDVTARLVSSKPAFTLNLTDELIESLAHDPEENQWYFGSAKTGSVYRYNPETQEIIAFLHNDNDGRQGVFSLEINAERRSILVLSSFMDAFETPQSIRRSSIYEYDLQTGVLLGRNDFYDGDEPRLLNDMERYSDGTLFISDAYYPAILMQDAKGTMKEFVFDPKGLASTQGLALDQERGLLYVADYRMGLFIYDIFTGEQIYSAFHEAPYTLKGIDGLALDLSKKRPLLYAVQNGSSPARILAISLNKDGRSFESVKALDQNNFNEGEPTVGVFVDNRFYFISNAPWPYLGPDGAFNLDYPKDTGINIRVIELNE